MRQTDARRARREQFMSDVLRRALDGSDVEVTVTPGGTPHGADLVTATIANVEVDGRRVGRGFAALFGDRLAHAGETGLVGVSTKWRDDMLHARSVSDASLLDHDDAHRVLKLGLAE